ncbi:hypothetical protein [Laspinema palackyanum]|nr:hypothetical protein [Laspinema sp. D2c]
MYCPEKGGELAKLTGVLNFFWAIAQKKWGWSPIPVILNLIGSAGVEPA